ncbi:MAG: helix-turn-helix transcriptional regulator [Armatimonadota bacterium]|nr:helix-turn-helix transcriptional regulator [Armatimonadota bacterium]
MSALMAEAIRHEPGADTAARAYAEIIRVLLERELQAANATGGQIGRQLAVLWEQVNADLDAAWDVARLASALCVSPAHLHRLTQQHHAVSPMAMVTRLRMRHAEAMLSSTNYTLDQVATAVGYETPFSFSRAFKAYCGLSPRLFRAERAR